MTFWTHLLLRDGHSASALCVTYSGLQQPVISGLYSVRKPFCFAVCLFLPPTPFPYLYNTLAFCPYILQTRMQNQFSGREICPSQSPPRRGTQSSVTMQFISAVKTGLYLRGGPGQNDTAN